MAPDRQAEDTSRRRAVAPSAPPAEDGTAHASAPDVGEREGSADASFQQVIERARRREPHAWAEIYERFSGQIFSFYLHQIRSRETAEDLTAGVFLEALQAADRFEGNVSALRSWLFRIARNNLIDHVRRDRRAVMGTIEEASEAELARAGNSEDPQDAAMAAIERERILAAIDRLSPDQREVMLLRLTGGLTSPEIANIVQKTVGAVKALQHRAMASLARSLSPAEGGAQ